MTYKIKIKGTIISNDDAWIYDLFDIEHTTPKMIDDALNEANGEDLEIIINSPGGSVFDGSEIYSILRDYPGNSIVKIVGVAASAASVIAMAGKKVMMSPTAQMMIHNATVSNYGDYRDMDHASGFLKSVNQSIINAYKMKSGKSDEELQQMMDKETWMTVQQALEHNLIDEVMFDEEYQAVAVVDSVVLPKQVINKIRNEGVINKPIDKSTPLSFNGLSEETVKQMFESFKAELKNEFKSSDQQNNKKDEQPAGDKPSNIARLFF